ncbi:Proton-translocating ferredoxin:NAD(+) oxidoreductase complex subunit C [subsurface metagenome]
MMKLRTFSQGIHPAHRKSSTQDEKIRRISPPKEVILPLQQHIGAPCQSLVKRGEEVRKGDKIAEAGAFVSAPIHASISGKVTAVELSTHPAGGKFKSIFIRGEGKEEDWKGGDEKNTDLSELEPQEIRNRVKEAGIVGLGGATFPTHVKLTPPKEKPLDTVILNGCECEPYLTGDHRLMLEEPEKCLFGLKAIIKAVGAQRGYVGIENNKMDAIALFKDKLAGEENVEVIPLRTKYPQGGEKMLVKAILNREVPSEGIPLDVGVVVSNIGTAVAIAECLKFNKPLIERVVTVSGSVVRKPANLLVPLGTPFATFLEECDVEVDKMDRVIMGGPMMGISQATLRVPVVKGTTAILVLRKEEVRSPLEDTCIRCAQCVDHCPLGLIPAELARLVKNSKWERLKDYHIMDCMECGCCAYVCPARIPIIQLIKLGKAEVQTKDAK